VLIIKSIFWGHFRVTHGETEKRTDRKVGLQSSLVAAKKHFLGRFSRNTQRNRETDTRKGALT